MDGVTLVIRLRERRIGPPAIPVADRVTEEMQRREPASGRWARTSSRTERRSLATTRPSPRLPENLA